MSTTLTPPPATPPAIPPVVPPAGSGGSGGSGGPGGSGDRTAPRVTSLVATIAGVLVLTVSVVTGIVSTVWGGQPAQVTLTAATAGLTSVRIEGGAADIEVGFADVPEARLTVTGSWGTQDWSMSRVGGELTIDSDRWWWPGWRVWDGGTRATLVLPAELAGIDASLRADAGSLTAEGRFGDLSLSLGAGTAEVSGRSTGLALQVDAGTARLDLADVTTARIDLNAGRVVGALTGDAPASLDLRVDAGSADLVLPDEAYAIVTHTELGSVSHSLDEDSRSDNRIEARVSVGSIALTPGR